VTTARAWLYASVLLTVAALVTAIVLAPPAGAAPVRALSWLLFTGSSVHVASTAWLFTVPAIRRYAVVHPVRCVLVPVSLVLVAGAAAAAISPARFQWLLLPYFGWQFHHYQKQNIGMASLGASAQRVGTLVPAERWPLRLAGWAGITALVARPGLLGLRVRPLALSPLAHEVFMFATATYAIAVAAGVVAIARRPRALLPAGFCAIYLTCLLFCLPAFVFGSPYAAVGGMTIAHGAQYLVLVTLIAGGGAGQTPSRLSRLTSLALLANISFIGGAALSAASHLHNASQLGRVAFGAYLGVVMAHFVIDAGLWRMRDPLTRRFLSTHLPYLVPSKPNTGGATRNPSSAPTDRSSADIECRI
jgi:hypothetical protein